MKIIKGLIIIVSVLFLTGWGKTDLQEGKDYFRAQQADKAIESFTKAIQANPKEQEAYFFRGATYSAIGQFSQAVEDYTKTIELNSQHGEAYWSRGYCYANMRMDDKAIADYMMSLKLGTKMEALVYELRAGAYYRKGMINEAEADLESVLRLKPGDQKAIAGLEDIKKAKADPNFKPPSVETNSANEQQWNEESARKEAFKDLKLTVDIEKYPSFDPDFIENQKALKENKQKVGDRYVTMEPSIGGYMVSKIDDKGYPLITMAYSNAGELLTVRLFSSNSYPKNAYVYVVKGDNKYKPGQLLFVSFHVSNHEMYNFNPEGKCTAHFKK